MPNYSNNANNFSISRRLISASSLCHVFMIFGIALAIIGAFIYLANSSGGYTWPAEKQASCESGILCIIAGIADALFCYVFSKILISLSTITQASELYFKTKK